jgi:hypothetical protein
MALPLPVVTPILQSITQSTVREVLYTHFERLVNERLPCIVLSGTDNDVVWSVLQGHPRAAEKIGSGISVFVLSRHVKNYKQPGLFVGRTDGTVVDFAIKKCFNRVTKGDETAWRLIMKRLKASGEFAQQQNSFGAHQLAEEIDCEVIIKIAG